MNESRRLFLTTLFKTAVAVPLIGTGTSVFLDSTKVFNPLLFTTMMEYEMSRSRTTIASIFDRDDAFYKAIAGGGKTFPIVRMKLRPGGYFK